MQKWEYIIVFSPLQVQLNELGAQGWELVSVVITRFRTRDEFGAWEAYLKRRI